MSPARGPQSAKQQNWPVTSAIRTSADRRRACLRSQAMSCAPYAVPVTMRNTSSAVRVTVKSASIPPRRFSAWV